MEDPTSRESVPATGVCVWRTRTRGWRCDYGVGPEPHVPDLAVRSAVLTRREMRAAKEEFRRVKV